MIVEKSEIFAVLHEFNPWWNPSHKFDGIPLWERSASREIQEWVDTNDTKRSLLITGARQIGKTTLLLQTIRSIVKSGFNPEHILYVTFDHPVLKLTGAEKVIQLWKELYEFPKNSSVFVFLDEIQFVDDWQIWLKHQADFHPEMRIAVTGSAIPLAEGQESGVGRWESLKLPTLSFYEFLMLREVSVPELPEVKSFLHLFDWNTGEFVRATQQGKALISHFHEYLMRGGFPEPAIVDDLTRCQKLLREDIVDKVLKRDMTAIFGVRRILEMEKVFLYLCFHDGGTLDTGKIAEELDGVKKPTVQSFLDLFEQSHLVYRLRAYGYGKEVLRSRSKYYLADPAIAGSVLLYGRKLLEKPDKLGNAVEAAFFKHLYTKYYRRSIDFSFWQDKRNKDREVDVVAELGDDPVPFEVKYQDTEITEAKMKGIRLFCEEKSIQRGYVITQRMEDFKVKEVHSARPGQQDKKLDTKIMQIPAVLALYWLSHPDFNE